MHSLEWSMLDESVTEGVISVTFVMKKYGQDYHFHRQIQKKIWYYWFKLLPTASALLDSDNAWENLREDKRNAPLGKNYGPSSPLFSQQQ